MKRTSRKPKRRSRRNAAETLYFRGTQGRDPQQTQLRQLSFTPCLGAALVYSAMPADAWSSSKERLVTRFVPTSTVTAAKIHASKVLDWPWVAMSLRDVLQSLQFEKENGITEQEVRKILNYMQNRAIGKVAAGEYKYKVFDEDGDAYSDWEDKPWGILETGVGYIRDKWDEDPSEDVALRLAADTFVFVDAPTVQKVAERLGFQAIKYLDVFGGAERALKDLLNLTPENVDCLVEDTDLEDDEVWSHETLRPLPGCEIEYVWQGPAVQVAREVLATARRDDDEVAANRKRRSRR